MSTHKHFLIIGTGGMGSYLVDEFVNLKESGAISTLKIASRSDAITKTHPGWFSRGGELVIVDYSDESGIVNAFKGVDIVIAAIAFEALEKQKDLIRAAKAAGVKLFVPTEYSVSADSTTTGIWSTKTHLNNWFKEFGFPYVRVFCGMWPEYVFALESGIDLPNGKATFGGSGDYRVSWTTREDTARFLGYVFTHSTTSELAGKTLRFEADNMTMNEVIEAYEKATNKKIEVTRTSREDLARKGDAGDLFAAYYYASDVHGAEVGQPLDNNLFPGWNPKKVLEVIL